jgi:2-oxoglutarate ferredoxin oxidoreductase subunit beta
MNSLLTDKKNSWCPGCGNFGILNAIQKTIHTLIEKGFDQDSLVMTSGIGCHGKIFDYLKLSGFYSLHGRAMSTAQGIKIGNPDLTVLMFGGDGDSMGEGLEHTLFAAKRNENITMILHNNGVYGLTTGQFSPLSKKGYKGPSSPFGNIEEPFNPLPLIIEAGATFVARSYSAKIEHVTQMLVKGIEHKGFSFIEILQPCVSFNNTYELFNERVQLFEEDLTHEQAILKAKSKDPVYIGVFRQFNKDVFSEGIIPDHYKPNNPDKLMTRKDLIHNML